MNSAVYSAYESLVKRGEYPFSLLNITIPFDQLDVNVHPMKIEVKFIDEWRVYHVVKSAVKDSISNILSTIPLFQQNQQFHGFNNSFGSNQNQEPINFNIFSTHDPRDDGRSWLNKLDRAQRACSVCFDRKPRAIKRLLE